MMLWWQKALLELILELEPKNFLSSTVNFLSRAKMCVPLEDHDAESDLLRTAA